MPLFAATSVVPRLQSWSWCAPLARSHTIGTVRSIPLHEPFAPVVNIKQPLHLPVVVLQSATPELATSPAAVQSESLVQSVSVQCESNAHASWQAAVVDPRFVDPPGLVAVAMFDGEHADWLHTPALSSAFPWKPLGGLPLGS